MDIEDLESQREEFVDDDNGQKGKFVLSLVVTPRRNFCRYSESFCNIMGKSSSK